MTYLDLTLKVRLRLHDAPELDPSAISEALQGRMNDWDEGRYPFEVEVVTHGLQRLVADTIEQATGKTSGTVSVHPEEYLTQLARPHPATLLFLESKEHRIIGCEVFNECHLVGPPLFTTQGTSPQYEVDGWCRANGYQVVRQEYKQV